MICVAVIAESTHPSLEGGEPFLHRRLGGIHDAGVHVAQFLEGRQVGGVVGVAEGVGGGLVKGEGSGVGGWIRHLAGVNLIGFEGLGFGHGGNPDRLDQTIRGW